ncbi:GNAT family N-acetyltransferase [Alphaproteobacteria bacterium GH1-50]|uniref:GNAT family N-acetyltransferase n=1 Tax=Kangsaoukella pontilimi TaxID=2691042 RepID=A0A7C9IQ56_9RHOB|nr:GNAT family protein [Kangsaoukella pontilimi]MXQ08770.1 GNAT family N-acetyltransferase [Kangsaoukella pontilimi]
MIRRRGRVRIDTERLILRPPVHADYKPWATLRQESASFLKPWEPEWSSDHLTRKSFVNRVYWANRSIAQGTAIPLFLERRTDGRILGAITLDNIRRGPAQAGTIGYWIGEPFARSGFMKEALTALVHHAFEVVDLSRIESACLPENAASRGLLEKCGYKYEGVAQSYLQIAGRWRNHVLYANLRRDRRGRVESRG